MNKKYSKNNKGNAKQAKSKSSFGQLSKSKTDWYLIGLIIAIIIISVIRLRLISVPFERDEGEYAFMGQLFLKGIAPYRELYTMKLPGTGLIYLLFMVLFGQSINGVHFGLLLMNAGTMTLLFFAFKRLYNPGTALFAAAAYGLMSVSLWVYGIAAHATHFINFFAALGIFFYSGMREKKRWLWAGLFGLSMGLAFLMKQQAVFLLAFGGIVLLFSEYEYKARSISNAIKSISAYTLGIILPYLIILLWVYSAGTFDKFWFWTVQYANAYAGIGSFWEGVKINFIPNFLNIFNENYILWITGAIGLLIGLAGRYSLKQKLFLLVFTLASALTLIPGSVYRTHYFISFLPALALCAAICLDFVADKTGRLLKTRLTYLIPFAVFITLTLVNINKTGWYYLEKDSQTVCKMLYGGNPFVESVEIAKYIKKNSTPEDKIAVLGSEPQIMFYSNRKSATGFIYTYGLMEDQPYNKTMQQEMIREMEMNKPKYLIFCKVQFSWVRRQNSPEDIFKWLEKTGQEKYEVVGAVDNIGKIPNTYAWDEELKTYSPQGDEMVIIFKRKSST